MFIVSRRLGVCINHASFKHTVPRPDGGPTKEETRDGQRFSPWPGFGRTTILDAVFDYGYQRTLDGEAWSDLGLSKTNVIKAPCALSFFGLH